MNITLLGPQHAQPSVARVLRELGVRGPVALVTAGWQERESDDAIVPSLGVAATNLTLHGRADELFARDPELALAYKARQTRLRLMQDFYRVRLDRLNAAAHAISQRHVDAELLADERAASIALVRELDRDHLARCRDVHAEFDARWATRESVAPYRRDLAQLIEPTDALLIAGGHVAVLLNRLRLFDVLRLAGARRIVAWSGGAMVLCEQVVLFHDDPPSGTPVCEVLDAGLGLVKELVVLPNPRVRLHLDDRDHVADFAQRFAGSACVAMDARARIDLADGRPAGGSDNQRLGNDGAIVRTWP